MKVLLILSVSLCAGGGFAATTQQNNNASGAVFCYYGSWSNERVGAGRFGVSDLPLDLCTHIVYSFLGLNATGELTFPTEKTVENKSNHVADLLELKKSNSDLKILAAIGGWTAGSENFSTVVNSFTTRANFVDNLYKYIDNNGFDGLDLDWEYPAQRGGVQSDKKLFITLIKELKAAFKDNGYLLTSAVAVTQEHIDLSYDVPELNKHLDFINLILYDFHGALDSTTGVNAPLYPQLTDDASINSNVNCSVHTWINNGASPSKLLLGLGGYGKTFTLSSLDSISTGAPSTDAGEAGPYTAQRGIWAYYEICESQKYYSSEWKITEVTGNYVYASKGLFWVGYDNPNTIHAKGQYAKSMGLGGIMFWALDLDDFSGLCGSRYPLISKGLAGYRSV